MTAQPGDPYVRAMRTNASSPSITNRAHEEFLRAERRVLDRYQAAAVPRWVDVAGMGRARVLVAGDGPPVVLVIGGGMVAAMWAPLLPHLNGFTTYVVDPPGSGSSDPVEYRRGELRTTSVRFLDGVLRGLGVDRAPLVGHSMGGLWSLWSALDRPEQVSAIACVACPALVLGTSAPLPMRLSTISWLNRLAARLDPPSPRQVDRMARMAGEDLSGLPELRALFVAAQRLPHAGTQMHQLLRAAVRVRGARPDAALGADELRQLRPPLRMIWGADDPFGAPAVGRRVVDLVGHGDLHLVDGGHAPWFSHADRVGPLLAGFLAAVSSASEGSITAPTVHTNEEVRTS
jgi:pimeloyl-ACP methyl ester carboxylesterase